jgi:cytochrome c oxidase subunit 2
MRGKGKARLIALAAGIGFALSACARDNFPQNTLAPQGPQAQKIDTLFQWVFWIAVVVFFLVEGALVYFAIKYRHRPGRPVPAQVHGNTRLEVAWTIIPAVLLAGIAVPTIATVFELARKPANALEITVTGRQWWWEVEYPGAHVTTANEVHIPTGQPVYITLRSQGSGSQGGTGPLLGPVIHSFWIPRLAGKQDVVPGRDNHLTLEAPNPGTYLGQCTEYCGLSHANMRMRVVAQAPQDFQAWLQQQLQPAEQPPADVLAIMDRLTCGGCHTLNGVSGSIGPYAGTIGPNLTHLAERDAFAGDTFPRTDNNLGDWVRDAPGMKPGADMPSFKDQLSDADIRALVTYLQSLT